MAKGENSRVPVNAREATSGNDVPCSWALGRRNRYQAGSQSLRGDGVPSAMAGCVGKGRGRARSRSRNRGKLRRVGGGCICRIYSVDNVMNTAKGVKRTPNSGGHRHLRDVRNCKEGQVYTQKIKWEAYWVART